MAELATHVSERHRDIALFHHDYRWKDILRCNRNVVGRLTLKIQLARHRDHVSLELKHNPGLHKNGSIFWDSEILTNLKRTVRGRPGDGLTGSRYRRQVTTCAQRARHEKQTCCDRRFESAPKP